jgi:MFS family permease
MLRRLWSAFFPFARFRRTDRRLVVLAWLAAVVTAFAGAHASSTVPFSRISLGLSEGDMSLVLSLARLAGFGALVFSWWADRHGRRIPFLAAFVTMLSASIATGFVTSAWQFAALQAVVRMSGTALGTMAIVLLAEQIAPDLRAFSISLYGAGGSLGAGIGLIALPLADLGPDAWRRLFWLSAVGLLALPLLVRGIPESRLFIEAERQMRVPLSVVLRSGFARRFWLAGSVNLAVNAFTAVALVFSIERLVDDVGFSTTVAVVVSLVGGTAGGIGFFVGGRLADLLGRRVVSIVSLVGSLIGGLGVYWLTELVPLMVAIAISTFGTFAYVPAAASHRTELFPTEFRTTANAGGAYLGMIGSALGLLVGRLTIDRIGLSETVTLLGTAVVVAIAVTLLLPETKNQDLAHVRGDR